MWLAHVLLKTYPHLNIYTPIVNAMSSVYLQFFTYLHLIILSDKQHVVWHKSTTAHAK